MVDRILIAADRFMPQLPGSTVSAGATGPVTLAGMLVQITAEALIHITIAQLRKPGCPVAMSGNVGILDMKTALMTMGAPENSLGIAAQAEIAKSFDLPPGGWQAPQMQNAWMPRPAWKARFPSWPRDCPG